MKNDKLNLSSQNEPLNNSDSNLYPPFNNNLPNPQIIEINRHQDIMMLLKFIFNLFIKVF